MFDPPIFYSCYLDDYHKFKAITLKGILDNLEDHTKGGFNLYNKFKSSINWFDNSPMWGTKNRGVGFGFLLDSRFLQRSDDALSHHNPIRIFYK